jgi:cytidylate kinase
MDPSEAKHQIQQAEAKRAAYYNYYTGKKWGHAESYDLCINTSVLGMDESAKMVAAFIRKRFKM